MPCSCLWSQCPPLVCYSSSRDPLPYTFNHAVLRLVFTCFIAPTLVFAHRHRVSFIYSSYFPAALCTCSPQIKLSSLASPCCAPTPTAPVLFCWYTLRSLALFWHSHPIFSPVPSHWLCVCRFGLCSTLWWIAVLPARCSCCRHWLHLWPISICGPILFYPTVSAYLRSAAAHAYPFTRTLTSLSSATAVTFRIPLPFRAASHHCCAIFIGLRSSKIGCPKWSLCIFISIPEFGTTVTAPFIWSTLCTCWVLPPAEWVPIFEHLFPTDISWGFRDVSSWLGSAEEIAISQGKI